MSMKRRNFLKTMFATPLLAIFPKNLQSDIESGKIDYPARRDVEYTDASQVMVEGIGKGVEHQFKLKLKGGADLNVGDLCTYQDGVLVPATGDDIVLGRVTEKMVDKNSALAWVHLHDHLGTLRKRKLT